MEASPYLLVEMEPSWKLALGEAALSTALVSTLAKVEEDRALGLEVYPPKDLVFNAFWATPFSKVKVLIMGQDPYHGPHQAHGLSFSVAKGIKPPPSLRNIFQEMEEDLGLKPPDHGCLESWAKQGVMMLNATLTVRRGKPLSHHGIGWESFTDTVVQALAEREKPLVFMLWGRSAQDKCLKLNILSSNQTKHLIIKSPHPSPYSARNGFFGSRPFSKANHFLEETNQSPIDWSLH